MTVVRSIYHLMRADFLERSRRYSYLVTVALTAFLGYLFVPPLDAPYQTVTLGNARGAYNSPWVGTMFGMLVTAIAPLIAFYLIVNAIRHDRESRVGQIIAGAPVSKTTYVLGKWLSNLALLVVLMGVLTVAAFGMQWVRGEDRQIQVWALVAPIWMMGLPVLAVVAAVAVLFEAVPFLSGGLGGVVYYFAFMAAMIVSISQSETQDGAYLPANDFLGLARPIADMQIEMQTRYPEAYTGQMIIGGAAFEGEPIVFHWEGIDWTPRIALERAIWGCLALPIVLIAALPFDRFDPARARRRRGRRDKRKADRPVHAGNAPLPARPAGTGGTPQERLPAAADGIDGSPGIGGDCFRRKSGAFAMTMREGDITAEDVSDSEPGWVAREGVLRSLPAFRLRPLPAFRLRPRPGALLVAELRLMLQGRPWWWYAVSAGLIAAGAAAPLGAARYTLPAAWLWPLLIWSQMGTREARHRTEALVFSAAYPLRRQLAATWLAGVLLTLAMGSGVAVHLLWAGETARLLALLVGAAFAPTLALACGAWSHTPRLFEVVYLVLWYGAFNGAAPLDYMGISAEGIAQGMSRVYMGLTLGLLAAAVIGRRIRLRR